MFLHHFSGELWHQREQQQWPVQRKETMEPQFPESVQQQGFRVSTPTRQSRTVQNRSIKDRVNSLRMTEPKLMPMTTQSGFESQMNNQAKAEMERAFKDIKSIRDLTPDVVHHLAGIDSETRRYSITNFQVNGAVFADWIEKHEDICTLSMMQSKVT